MAVEDEVVETCPVSQCRCCSYKSQDKAVLISLLTFPVTLGPFCERNVLAHSRRGQICMHSQGHGFSLSEKAFGPFVAPELHEKHH